MSDAQQQAAPAQGMRRIPFPLESYEHPSVPLSAKRVSNLMAEQQPADARSPAVLIPTPGLSLYRADAGSGPVHIMNDEIPGGVYFVSGTHFFRLSSPPIGVGGDFVLTDLGDIGVPATDVIPFYQAKYTIAVGLTAAVVCSPPNAWTCPHDGPINQIGGDFPGAASVAHHDGYFVFTGYGNDTRFFISHLLDPNAFDALDFAYSDALPNVIRRVISHRTDLWMMGEAGIEIWYDAGNPDFPFRRRSGGVIASGIASVSTVAAGDGSVFWVTHNHLVMRSVGYQAERISSHAIEAIIKSAELGGPFNVVSSFCYTEQGHTFYVLNWQARTLVYDCATKLWHDRHSPGLGRWRVNASAHPSSFLMFGDALSGRLFMSVANGRDAAMEDGAPIDRQLIFPPIWAGTRRAFCSRIEVELESGDPRVTGAVMQLDWSDDGGYTYSPARSLSVTPGARRQRVFTTRLGSFRQRVFRLTLRGAITIYAADAEITGGAH